MCLAYASCQSNNAANKKRLVQQNVFSVLVFAPNWVVFL